MTHGTRAGFTAPNPAWEAAVRESFSRQTLMAILGAGIAHLAPGEVHLRLPYSPALCQQNGYLHAGAIASVADSANGFAAFSRPRPTPTCSRLSSRSTSSRPPGATSSSPAVGCSGRAGR